MYGSKTLCVGQTFYQEDWDEYNIPLGTVLKPLNFITGYTYTLAVRDNVVGTTSSKDNYFYEGTLITSPQYQLVVMSLPDTEEPNITVTIPYTEAVAYAKQYSGSKYLKPALDKINVFRSTPFASDRFTLDKYPAGTVIVFNGEETYTKMKGGIKVWCRNGTDNVIIGNKSEIAEHSQVIFVPKGETPKEISFEMPLSVARKFNDCTIQPLVKAYDRENAPEIKVGDMISINQARTLPRDWILTYDPGSADPQAVITNGQGSFHRAWNEGAGSCDYKAGTGDFLVLWKPK